MDARYRKCYLLAVIAWAIVIAFLLWLPPMYLIAPSENGHHGAGLAATIVLIVFVLVLGWAGFKSICALFHDDQ